jgi:hypothetical protein
MIQILNPFTTTSALGKEGGCNIETRQELWMMLYTYTSANISVSPVLSITEELLPIFFPNYVVLGLATSLGFNNLVYQLLPPIRVPIFLDLSCCYLDIFNSLLYQNK